MAFLQISLMSEALLRTVNVNAIIPVDKVQLPDQAAPPTIQRGNFKTLYLLHGIFGSQVDWINGTMLQRWAEEKNIAVIMPAPSPIEMVEAVAVIAVTNESMTAA